MLDGNLNELVVVKRSGQRISFNGTKIAVAIKHAFDNVYKSAEEEKVNKVYSYVLNFINSNYSDRKTINVEDIQDIIEKTLKEEGFIEVYNAFSEYRVKRSASRDIFDRKQQHKFVRATEKLVLAANDEENNNPTELLLNFGKTISNEFSKAYLIDSKYIRSHDEGTIYIHDLDYYVLGTISNTFIDLTNIPVSDNYFQKIIMTLLNLKKEMYGEECISSIDYLLIPYLLERFKKIFIKTIKSYYELEGFDEYISIKGIENIIQKINTIYIDFSLFDKYLLSERVRKIFESAYSSSIKELKFELKLNIKNLLITLNELKCGIDCDSAYSISIGSCDTKDGIFIRDIYFEVINELDTLDRVTTIYKVKSDEYLEHISKLICLNKNIVVTFVNTSYNKKLYKNDGFKFEVEYFSNGDKITDNVFDRNQTSLGRMMTSKTSINLVRIALNSKNLDEFYNNLSSTLDLVKNELLQEFEYLSSKYKENFEHIFNFNYLIDSEKLENGQKIKKVIKNGTLSIGYIGLAECITLLNGNLNLAENIVKFMKNKCDEYSNEYKLNFALKESCEKCALRYLKALDKSIYGSIIGVTDKDSYGIFSDCLVNETFENRFKIEKELHKYSNGGYKEVIYLPKNYSYKKLYEILLFAKEYDIGYIKIKMGKRE